jgi:predicted Zn-dependent protease
MGEGALRAALEPLVDALRAGHYPAAVEGLKCLLAEHPDNEVVAGLLGAAYFQIGLPDRAQALFERVLQINPDNALARTQLTLLRGIAP